MDFLQRGGGGRGRGTLFSSRYDAVAPSPLPMLATPFRVQRRREAVEPLGDPAHSASDDRGEAVGVERAVLPSDRRPADLPFEACASFCSSGWRWRIAAHSACRLAHLPAGVLSPLRPRPAASSTSARPGSCQAKTARAAAQDEFQQPPATGRQHGA